MLRSPRRRRRKRCPFCHTLLHLHPLLAGNPALGEPLLRELEGLRKDRVRRFRIVYSIDHSGRTIRIFAVDHRRAIYETVAALIRGR